MPGIVGIIRKPGHGQRSEGELSDMVEAMRHEAFYRTGTYSNDDLGLYVGWACQEGLSDQLPLISQDRDLNLIFYGENYPRGTGMEPNAGPKSKNSFRSDGPDILKGYLELKNEFFRELNGWYSGVVADRGRNRVTLFNDRYGMGRVYVYQGKDEFIFASEAKCILKIRPELREISPEALGEYLRYDCVTRGKTLFKSISLLPNSSAWQFENGALINRGSYFDPSEWENLTPLSQTEFYRRFVDVLTNVVPAYAQPSDKVALSLTAGLDSRLIMAALGANSSRYPCYTFGGRWGKLYDVRIARRLAKIHKQSFEVIKTDDYYFRNFPSIAQRTIYISDGTHDAFGAHDLYLNQVARRIAPVRLTGKFGSEIVRIRNLIPSQTYPSNFFCGEFKALFDQLPDTRDLQTASHRLTRVAFEEIPWHEFGRIAIENSQVVLRTPYMDNSLVRLMYQAPKGTREAGDLQEDYIRDKAPELAELPTNFGRFISKNRAMTQFFELCARVLLKLEYIYLFPTPHWVTYVDRKLARLKPEQFIAGRQKWESYRIWIKTDLGDFVQDTLRNPRAEYSRYFDRKTVERMVERHVAGTHNYLNEINKALSVELIHLSLIER